MNVSVQPPPAIRTTCPYCGVGCGLLAQPDGCGDAAVTADPTHPANFGKLCSKGSALGETLDLDGRVLHPMLRQTNGTLARIGWDTALETVADGFRRIIERDGPNAVAFYLSGQLLTEDYYVANKLMKGFLGSPNVDTNSRLCMASSVAGHRRAFGADTVPGVYADLDEADLIILVGSNAAWCHPVLFQRMLRNKTERGARIVVVDPRRTMTADDADLFLPIAPGADTALFCGLLVHLAETDALDAAYINTHTSGFAPALARARDTAPDVAATAAATGLQEADVVRFFELFRTTSRTVTCFSQGVNQSAQGTDKVNAIINCHLATGRIGKPGMGPFSLTGQPNAMGGREVGGLANQLAAHMGFTPPDIDRVRRFWNAPRMAEREGLKAVPMFEAIARGEIKALWVMATNPAVSLPRAGAVREALKKLELFVVSENVVSNDTVNAGAHVLLPAAAWGEKDGTVTNSERCISRQRAFLPAPGEAKPDWQIVSEVARRIGFGEAFAYGSVADVFREHAALSCFENDGTRDFDLGGLAKISDAEFDALEPVQWPVNRHPEARAQRASKDGGQKRFFANGGFFTPDRKARFIAVEPPALKEDTSAAFPLRLNTGRIRDQWHTMTRTGKSARLATHLSEPFVEVHPQDASAANLTDGGFAQISTPHGAVIVKVVVSENQRPGSLFMPIHWSGETASCARVGDLISPQVDPHSGQPESKATPAAIAAVLFSLHGFARARHSLMLPEGTWWARVAVAEGSEYRLATSHGPMIWHDFAYGSLGGDARIAEQVDGRSYRAAAFVDGEVEGYLCIGPADAPPQWNVALFSAADVADGEPLQARALKEYEDYAGETEPVICACFQVGVETVRKAVVSGVVRTVEEIGYTLRAGTNCGSCLPELK
ncbi:MAG: assimilatory nitrate reductase catalytic subunit, partial [Alphaproteobacteria bacterium]|nr:assimilatory nitrate reductase catalytic subunit [Alphaproteobacteria bacterium]